MRQIGSGIVTAMIIALSTLSSCIYDDREDCTLSVHFNYIHNVKSADAFPAEVRSIDLYIFNDDKVFLDRYSVSAESFGKNYAMHLPSLEAGTYFFVALGRNRILSDTSYEFEYSELTPGVSVMDDLTMHLGRNGNKCDADIAALYNGVATATLKDGRQRVDIELKKLTNKYRIIILPYDGTTTFKASDFDFRIEADGGWLDHEGGKFCEDALTWLPFSVVATSTKSSEVSSAVVADLSSSRLWREENAQLIIGDGKGGEYLRINLPWFLSLQGIAEHRSEWSDQEYLDRQDFYSITFFIDGNLFVKSKIIVNGWVLSLSDVSLG